MAETLLARAPARRPAVLGVAAVAVVAALAFGRFVTFDESSPAARPVAAPATAEAEIAALERTVADAPDDVATRQALAVAYVQEAAATGDPSYYGLAEAALDEADRLMADDPGTLLGRGALALALHDFAGALDFGSAALAARPMSPDALGIVVDAQVELGRYDESVATLQQLLDVRPGLPALARASYARELHGDLTGAIDLMQRAEVAGAAQPKDAAIVAALLGDLWLKAGDLSSAAAAYERAGSLPAAEVGRARVLAAQGEDREAVAVLEDVVDRYPQPEALVLLAELQTRLGDTEGAASTDALVRATAALQESSGQVVDLEMAVFEADGGDTARAVALAQRAFDARPGNVFAADALAWAHLRNGDPAAARPFVDRALRLATADPRVRLHAASVLHAVGEVAGAREQVTAAAPMHLALGAADGERLRSLAAELGVDLPAAQP